MSEEVYTVEHAAERLKLHPKTVLRAIRDGRLPAVKLGKSYRILRSDLNAFAGLPPRPATPAGAARATAVVDVPDVDPDLAQRLMSRLPASLKARGDGEPAVRADVIYDPDQRQLKIIILATPADAGTLLKLVQVWLED